MFIERCFAGGWAVKAWMLKCVNVKIFVWSLALKAGYEKPNWMFLDALE